MARYRKVEVKTWVDNKFRQLSPMPPSGRGLWLFLMTGPFTGPIPGLFRAGRAAMAEELEWDIEAFNEAFREVSSQGMAKADFKERLVWLPNALKHNKPESPNVVRSWRDEIELLPECDLKNEAIASIRNHLMALGAAYLQAFDEILTDENKPSSKASRKASPKATPNQEQEQEQEKEIDHGTSAGADDLPQQAQISESESGLNPEQLAVPESGLNPDGPTEPVSGLTPEQVSEPAAGLNPERTSGPVPPAEKINYQTILDVYHEVLPEMPRVKILTDDRKKHLRTFWKKYQFDDRKWRSYLGYIATHCRWMLTDRPNGRGGFWKCKNLDYLITERCYVAVKEERANDK